MAKDRARTEPRERKFTVRVESPGECKRLLKIEIPWEEMIVEEGLVLDELRRDIKVPGFRKGKVPLKYIEKNYKESVRSEAVRNLLPAIYEAALVREGIAPVGDPHFDNVKTDNEEPITMDVTVEVRPDPKIEGYKDINIQVERRKIDDEAVLKTLEQMREQMATLKVVDRPIRDDDYVLIDYGPLMDDDTVDKEKLATNYPIDLREGSLLPEFQEGLIRMSTGEDKDITVKYPDEFPDKENAGQKKTFRVTVKEIKEREMPELDDSFAQGMGEQFKSLNDLKQKVKENLIEEEEKRLDHSVQEEIISKLIDKNTFDVPDAMVQNYLASVVEEDRRRRPQVHDEEARVKEIQEHFRDAAVRTIKKYFILEAVKKQESIMLESGEVDAKINELAGNDEERAAQVQAYFRHPEHRRSLESDLLDRKILNFLTENAQIKVA